MNNSDRLKDSKTCRIFFSSPFGGMEEEREELTRKYFPQIHHLCNQRGLQFVAVDMRWGITSEASASSQVINICLRELDRSDMFVGFFGQRYGWYGRNDTALQENFDNAVGTYPWLNNYRDRSVTELEFLHGHLNHPGELPAIICFRDKTHDDKLRAEGESKGDKKQVMKYSAEDETSISLMEDLKQRCWNTRDKSLGVHLNYKDPIKGAELMFEAIWKHLMEVLLKDTSPQSQSARSLRLAQHDVFMLSRSKMFGDMSDCMKTLNSLVSTESPVGTLVLGDAGSGKSTLLCKWIKHLQTEFKSEVTVVYHFVGYGENSTGVSDILNQLCEEFEYKSHTLTGADNSEGEGGVTYKQSDNNLDLIRKITIASEKLLKLGKRTVIVIDGVDKVLKETKTEKHLYWLPSNLPQGTVLVVSTPSVDMTTVEELHDKRGFQLIKVAPLSEEIQKEFCVETLKESGKELSPSQLEKIIHVKQTENPLFLKILLSELVVFGYFRLLDKKIDSLIACQSVDELCSNVLNRLEEDYNVKEHQDNLVEQVMCTICLSRQGMSEGELIKMYSIPSHLWSPLYFAAERYFINQSGQIQFGFREFKEAVERKYLVTEEKRQQYLQNIADYFEKQKQRIPLVYRVGNDPNIVKRISHELPWAYLRLGKTQGIITALTEISVFSCLYQDCYFYLYDLWRQTQLSWEQIADLYIKAFDLKIADLYLCLENTGELSYNSPGASMLTDLKCIKKFIADAGSFAAREKVSLKQLELVEDLVRSGESTVIELEQAEYDLAVVYADVGMFSKAEVLHKKVLEKREKRIPDPLTASSEDRKFLGNSYHGLAVVCMKQTKYDQAEELFWKSKKLSDTEDVESDMATCYTNLGLIEIYRGNYDLALKYSMKALEIEEEVNFGQLPLSLSHLLLNIGLIYRRKNDLEEARKYYKRSLDIKLNTVGEMHPDVCVSYINLAILNMLENDLEGGLVYYEKALHIYRTCKTPDTEAGYIRCWENQIKCLVDCGRIEEALESFLPFFDVLEREQKLGNPVLIDGTFPEVHVAIVSFLINQDRCEEAERIVLAFISSAACDMRDYICLDIIDKMAEVKPDRPENLTLEYAVEKWPEDVDLILHKVTRQIVPSGDTEKLIQYMERLPPDLDISVYDAVNSSVGQTKPFNEEMFEKFNRLALKHFPDSVAFKSNLAESLRRQKKHEQALPYLMQLVDLTPDNLEWYIQIAQSALLMEKFDLDLAKSYCSKIKDKFQDERSVSVVNQLNGFIAEIEEWRKNPEQE